MSGFRGLKNYVQERRKKNAGFLSAFFSVVLDREKEYSHGCRICVGDTGGDGSKSGAVFGMLILGSGFHMKRILKKVLTPT